MHEQVLSRHRCRSLNLPNHLSTARPAELNDVDYMVHVVAAKRLSLCVTTGAGTIREAESASYPGP